MAKTKINIDDLEKSLQDLEFTQDEIQDLLQKAIKENEAPEEKEDDDEGGEGKPAEKEVKEKETIDEEAQKNEMQKACDKITAMKDELDKSMADFLNRFGSAPHIPTPNTDLHSNGPEAIQKSLDGGTFEKAFGEKFDTIMKSFQDQNEKYNELNKSLQEMGQTVKAIAEAPNPLKSLLGNYSNNILEKGGEREVDGKRIINLRNKELATEEFFKAIDKIDNEPDKQVVRDMISSFSVANRTSQVGLDIVKKALNIDFEK